MPVDLGNMETLHLISDFNVSLLGRYLVHDREQPVVDVKNTPFGQLHQTLLDVPKETNKNDTALVWSRPEAALNGFADRLGFGFGKDEELVDQVDRYAERLVAFKNGFRFLLVPTWVVQSYHRGFGLLDWRSNLGVSHLLAKLNLRLSENLENESGIFVLDTARWLIGAGAAQPKLWYTAKVPFANAVFETAAKEIMAAIDGLGGHAKKIVIVDLDDVLWGGVVGETGWRGIHLGGHSPEGEAFVDFQENLKALTRRGIQLAIVSKNDEQVALEAIDRHPEMVLARSDFATWRISWQDKAVNVAALMAELNLNVDSAVFIDDSPQERDRVRAALPQVLVPEWPTDPAEYVTALHNLRCFDTPALSSEDSVRTRMYQEESLRKNVKESIPSLSKWLMELGTEVAVEDLNGSNLLRTAQLINKTNQMNMTTRRLSEEQLTQWTAVSDHELWTFRVSDKFGELGLTGVITLKVEGNQGEIVDFILSCRVMGREVERTMLHWVVARSRERKISRITARYLPTPRNRPCLEFWRASDFREVQPHLFTWEIATDYPKPASVTLVIA